MTPFCRFFLALLAGAAMTAAAQAREADPLSTPECKAARRALDDATSAAKDDSRAGNASLAAAKRQAALACFGTTRSPSAAGRAARPPAVVPPTVGAQGQPPVVAEPAPPVRIPRPAAITSCDAGGCWDSNGARLNRMGPGLTSPGGGPACSVQGGFAHCP
jgi:hypothetical protein